MLHLRAQNPVFATGASGDSGSILLWRGRLAPDALEVPQEVDEADEAALLLTFRDFPAALGGAGYSLFRADGYLPAFHAEG